MPPIGAKKKTKPYPPHLTTLGLKPLEKLQFARVDLVLGRLSPEHALELIDEIVDCIIKDAKEVQIQNEILNDENTSLTSHRDRLTDYLQTLISRSVTLLDSLTDSESSLFIEVDDHFGDDIRELKQFIESIDCDNEES